MNLLEQYIEEIHSEEPFQSDWTECFPGKNFVKVDVTTNCYGNRKRDQHYFEEERWKSFKEQGYWMG